MTGVPRLPGPINHNPKFSFGWEPLSPQCFPQSPCKSHCPSPDVPLDHAAIPPWLSELSWQPEPAFPKFPALHTAWVITPCSCRPTTSAADPCWCLLGPAVAVAAGSEEQATRSRHQGAGRDNQAAAAPPAPTGPPAASEACFVICCLLAWLTEFLELERGKHVWIIPPASSRPPWAKGLPDQLQPSPSCGLTCCSPPGSGTSGIRKWEQAGGSGKLCVDHKELFGHPVMWFWSAGTAKQRHHCGRLPLTEWRLFALWDVLSSSRTASVISVLGTHRESGCRQFLSFPAPLAALVVPQEIWDQTWVSCRHGGTGRQGRSAKKAQLFQEQGKNDRFNFGRTHVKCL